MKRTLLDRLVTWRWPVALLVALVLGALAGLLPRTVDPAGVAVMRPSDRADEAIAHLRSDPFYVGPELRRLVNEEDRAAITAELGKAAGPTYLLFMADTPEGGYYLDAYLLDRVAAQLGSGYYATVNEKMDVTARDYGVDVEYVGGDSLKTRPGDGLRAYASELGDLEWRALDESGSDYWGGTGGGIAAGALFAALVSLALGLMIGLAKLVRRTW